MVCIKQASLHKTSYTCKQAVQLLFGRGMCVLCCTRSSGFKGPLSLVCGGGMGIPWETDLVLILVYTSADKIL